MALQKFEQLAAVAVPGTGTLTLIYKCPIGRKADVNINIANSVDTLTDIKLAHIKNDIVANVAAEDFLLGGLAAGLPTSVLANNLSPIEKNGVAMSVGDEIAVFSSASALAVQINGIEEDA